MRGKRELRCGSNGFFSSHEHSSQSEYKRLKNTLNDYDTLAICNQKKIKFSLHNYLKIGIFSLAKILQLPEKACVMRLTADKYFKKRRA